MLKSFFDKLPFKKKGGGAEVDEKERKEELKEELDFGEGELLQDEGYEDVAKEMEGLSEEEAEAKDEFSELEFDDELEKKTKSKDKAAEKRKKVPGTGKKIFGLPLPIAGAAIALVLVVVASFLIIPGLFKKEEPVTPSTKLAQKYEMMRQQALMRKMREKQQAKKSPASQPVINEEKKKVATLVSKEKQLTASQTLPQTESKPSTAKKEKPMPPAPPVITSNIAVPKKPSVPVVAPPPITTAKTEKKVQQTQTESKTVPREDGKELVPQRVKLVKPELGEKKKGYEAKRLEEIALTESSFLYKPKQPEVDTTKKEVSKIVDTIILNVAKRFYQDDLSDVIDFSTLQRLSWEDLMKLKSSLKIFLEVEKMRSELMASRLNMLSAQLNFAKELQKAVEGEKKKNSPSRIKKNFNNALITGIVGKGALGSGFGSSPKRRPPKEVKRKKKEEKKEKKKVVIVKPLPEIEGIFDEGVIIRGRMVAVGERYDTYRLQDVDFDRKVARFVNEVNGVVVERSLSPFFVAEEETRKPIPGLAPMGTHVPPLPPSQEAL